MTRKNRMTYEFILEKDFGNNIISLKEVLKMKNRTQKKVDSLFLDNNISYESIYNLKKSHFNKNNLKTINYKKKND